MLKAWQDILIVGKTRIPRSSPQWKTILSIGEHPKNFYNPFIFRLKNVPSENVYFILFDTEKTFPWLEIIYILNHAAILNGLLPLHASAVIHQGSLFVFSGTSGAGKSTIAAISNSAGNKVLDEDQIIIRENGNGEFFANAWGYSLESCENPIRAIFKLLQAKNDSIKLMSAMMGSKFLFTRVLEICGKTPPNPVVENTFSFIARVTRSIPCYELHFRKSPDFWKLIDAELPPITPQD